MNTARKLDLERGKGLQLLFVGGVMAVSLILGQRSACADPAKTELSDPALRAKEMALVMEIHKKIVANSKETTETAMKKYRVVPLEDPTLKMPATPFFMLPIKGGSFTMGSREPKSDPPEVPAHTVTLDPFWMQQCEVTWNEYAPFMYHDWNRQNKQKTLADAIVYPTKPLIEREDGFPAVSMSQHAANKYCQWLSARTGHFYRLPTEAEWEYACRAGTESAYSFGDNPADLGQYGWFKENSNGKSQRVGKKLPNPWGLHDMHGNVAEWTLDGFAKYEKAPAKNPWIRGTDTYPHAVRGGSWDDPAELCRSASRQPSDRSWNQDPILRQKAVWILERPTVGFRVVRPLKAPTAEEMFRYWNNEVEFDLNK
ncbi:MAG: formylglycine-generating enzyme family protein [Verrucomicrobia bacterium]|nr:formylglycine-generating enzyme family protein [Verrucomicrobiota bacterium]